MDQTSVEFKGNAWGPTRSARSGSTRRWPTRTGPPRHEQTGDYQDLPPAIMLDVDETVLNTSAIPGVDGARRTAFAPRPGASAPTKSRVAIPGAVDFTKYADSKGVKVFYVTNRT